MDDQFYREYRMRAAPTELDAPHRWSTEVNIAREVPGSIKWKSYGAKQTRDTKEEAIGASLDFGRRIIDGLVPGMSPP